MDVKQLRGGRRRRARAVGAGDEGRLPAGRGRRRRRARRAAGRRAPARPRRLHARRARSTRSCARATRCWPSTCTSGAPATRVGGCMAELTEVRTDGGRRARSRSSRRIPPSWSRPCARSVSPRATNVCMARGLKALVGFGAKRYAVIDVGTNSVKLHVGERRADGTWSTVVDRAEVTRLGEGLDAAGSLEPEPMKRTVEAIAGMADEARRDGAVDDRGRRHRRAARRGERRGARRRRRGPLRRPDRGHPGRGGGPPRLPRRQVRARARPRLARRLRHRRRQLPVHVRPRRARSTSGSASTSARRASPSATGSTGPSPRRRSPRRSTAIAADLDRLDGRPSPDALVGMGGARHQPRRRQARARRRTTRTSSRAPCSTAPRSTGRSSSTAPARPTSAAPIVGLQPNRAEVILAGACVVRTVLDEARPRLAHRERPRPAPRPDRRTASASARPSARAGASRRSGRTPSRRSSPSPRACSPG